MTLKELLHRQWEGYPRSHRAPGNLLIHVVAVPLFLAGNIAVLLGLAMAYWPAAVAGLVAMALSMALQGQGHKAEVTPPEPFTGVFNAACRIFFEQWLTFPRFVLSGGWLRALRSGYG
jgi:hypothetical protein